MYIFVSFSTQNLTYEFNHSFISVIFVLPNYRECIGKNTFENEIQKNRYGLEICSVASLKSGVKMEKVGF